MALFLEMNLVLENTMEDINKGFFWSVGKNKIDIQKDNVYIVNQVLAYGNLEDIKKLIETYTSNTIKEVFINQPKKIYTPSCFNFVKNHVLHINQKINKERYVKSLY